MTVAVPRTPQRRASDHVHNEYWEILDQHRFEDRIADEMKGMRQELRSLRQTVTLLMGAIGILAFMLPIIAPFIRSVLQLQP